ncbi:hypothetical protein HAX54_034588 [Datura stramonium]|uniref:RING-type E3 ubiquitin transferase n=1 Tax=Datura stramonium TaxID=4076 RepID=A0ABS8VFA7_DATST|nr:hypothetical protein [Datura stramonium]
MNSNYYVPTNIFVPHGPTWFDNIEDPYLWDDDYNQQPMGEFIYVTNRSGFIDHHQGEANNHYASRNIGDHYFAPHNLDHNYYAFTGPHHMYNGQSSFHHIEDLYLWDDVYNRPTDLLQHLLANMEGNEDDEAAEEIIENLIKTRPHSDADNEGEICVICQCEYENEETIGTLECEHEYHESCIKQWLLMGRDLVQFVGLHFIGTHVIENLNL